MSVQALSWVLDSSEAEHSARLVLIAIANHASQDGDDCFPSLRTIAREARISERQVCNLIPELERLGELLVVRGGGRKNRNSYLLPKFQITLKRFQCNEQHENGLNTEIYGDGNTEISSSAIRNNRPLKQPSIKATVLPEWMPIEEWAAFLEMRKAIRQSPFTQRAQGLIITKLAEMRAAGQDVAAILNQSTMNGWRGVFPLKGSNGNGRSETRHEQQMRELLNTREAAHAILGRKRENTNP